MELLNHRLDESGLILETSEGMLRVQGISEGIARATYTKRGEFSLKPSLCVLPRRSPLLAGELREEAGHLDLALPGLRLRVERSTCAFSWFDSEGRLLAKEPARGGKSLQPFTLTKFLPDPDARVVAMEGADGLAVKVESGRRVPDRSSFHGKLAFDWAAGEALYGLGSHEEGVMNLRGTCQYLYQQNMKVVVPVLVSTRGYGVLVDNASPMVFRDDAFGSYVRAEACEELDYYFFTSPTMAGLTKAYRELTGPVPMLPRWAFGYVQSKERYRTQEEILAVAAEFRSRGIPLDLIVLDWMSWEGQLWGQKSFDRSRFPDPAAMIRELHGMGVRFMISIWPNMREGGENHAAMRDSGFLLGNDATYDAFDPEARALYWKQAEEGLFSAGVDAWWCDCTEPFEADWNGAYKAEPEERAVINVGEASKYLDMERLNAYSLLHSEGLYRGQRAVREDKRVVNLTRSGFAGQQRYSTIVWSGDWAATWEALRAQVPAGLNFCATGMPWWTTDIGAFFAGRRPDLWFWSGDYPEGCSDPAYRELYLRWFQYGAFLPMFRSHGTDTPREPWRFGEEGEPIYDALVSFIKLRSRLLPYLYSSAADVCLRGGGMMRPVAFDFPGDEACHDLKDQYLFGPSLMPCPMVESLESSGPRRGAYLPAGADWYDFWTGARHSGGSRIEAAAPLGIMPLYARSGSILPMRGALMHADEGPGSEIELRVYPGADADCLLYEDAGDGYGYEKGEYAEIALHWDDASRTLAFGARAGAYPGMRAAQGFRVVIVSAEHGAGAAEESAADARLDYEGRSFSRRIPSASA
jgi:alpha-D-xyloside xylohydrolase